MKIIKYGLEAKFKKEQQDNDLLVNRWVGLHQKYHELNTLFERLNNPIHFGYRTCQYVARFNINKLIWDVRNSENPNGEPLSEESKPSIYLLTQLNKKK